MRINITHPTNQVFDTVTLLDELDDTDVTMASIDKLNRAVGFLESAAAELRTELKRCKDGVK